MRQALWYLIGGGIAFASIVAFVLRADTTTSTPALALVGLTPLLLVPLIGLAVSAWVTCSSLLRLATVGLWLVYLATFPMFRSVVGCATEHSDDEITLVTHNVHHETGDPAAVALNTAGVDADILVLQEVDQAFADALAAQPSLDQLRYRATEPKDGSTGLAVWSRWPLDDATLEVVADAPRLTVEVRAPTGSFTLVAVHTIAPLDSAWAASWSLQLTDLVRQPHDDPTILAGDFNATSDHAQFRAVLDAGWTDVHQPKGCGFDATWPKGRLLPFAVLRLDHVLVSDHFEVLGVDIGPAAGSDHASVIATIRLADDPPTDDPPTDDPAADGDQAQG